MGSSTVLDKSPFIIFNYDVFVSLKGQKRACPPFYVNHGYQYHITTNSEKVIDLFLHDQEDYVHIDHLKCISSCRICG